MRIRKFFLKLAFLASLCPQPHPNSHRPDVRNVSPFKKFERFPLINSKSEKDQTLI